MKYTSNDIQIILIHPVVSAGQGGAKVVDHPVYSYLCAHKHDFCTLMHVKVYALKFNCAYTFNDFFNHCYNITYISSCILN